MNVENGYCVLIAALQQIADMKVPFCDANIAQAEMRRIAKEAIALVDETEEGS